MNSIPENKKTTNNRDSLADNKSARIEHNSPRANYQTASPLSPAQIALLKPQRSKRRSRREREVAQYYNRVTGKALSAFKAPDIAFDFFAGGIFPALGYDLSDIEPVELFDEKLARAGLGFTHKPTDEEKDATIAREADRRRKQRERLIRWQNKSENPLLFEHNNDFNKQTRKRNSTYIFYFPELVRDIVKAAPVGSSMAALDAAVREHCSAYLERFTGEDRRVRPKQRQSIASIVKRGATELSRAIAQVRAEAREKAEREQHEQTAESDAENELWNLFETEFAAKLPPAENALFYKWATAKDNILHGVTASPTGQLSGGPSHTLAYSLLRNRVSQSEDEAPPELLTVAGACVPDADVSASPAVELGQTVEAFIASNPAYQQSADARPGQPTAKQVRRLKLYRAYDPAMTFADASARITELITTGAEPFATDAQTALLARAGVADSSLTISQAAERIRQLYAEGAFLPGERLSLAELRSFDPKAREGRTKRRYRCPKCSDSRKKHKERTLRVNVSKGTYCCFHCREWGFIAEHFADAANYQPRQFPALPKPEPTAEEIAAENRWRNWFASAQPITADKPNKGAAYLASRGISAKTAQAAGVRFGNWWAWVDGENDDDPGRLVKFPAEIFRNHDQPGELVAAHARAIVGDLKRTKGQKELGIFAATPDALDANLVAVTEGPIDALALVECGYSSIGMIGTVWPMWLPEQLAGSEVLIATDADSAGDEASALLADDLKTLATTHRARPEGGKDWGEVFQQHGRLTVEAQIDFALGCAEPGSFDDVEGF